MYFVPLIYQLELKDLGVDLSWEFFINRCHNEQFVYNMKNGN